MKLWKLAQILILTTLIATSCSKTEVDEASISSINTKLPPGIVNNPGPPSFTLGNVGGAYTGTLLSDPKTFNTLTARDSSTRAVIDSLFSDLLDYDPYTREFTPHAAASFEVIINEEEDTLSVHLTLRDDLYWTTPDGKTRIAVTADDVIFWYNEIEGDIDLQQPGYPSQFLDMPDGSKARITIRKIDRLSFAFDFPRIISLPLLSSNMTFGPRFLYEPAKQSGGIPELRNLLDVSTDVMTIPSMGPLHIVEYKPGKYVRLQRNPNYWEKDDAEVILPYYETLTLFIVPDLNTSFLLFQSGEIDSYNARPEDLDVLLKEENTDFSIYSGGPSLGSDFITFNQNPNTVSEPKLSWFGNTKFRQAMSSFLNRPRIAKQVYRGLAEPARHFFAPPNPYFDADIKLEFTYNTERAKGLLAEIGIQAGTDDLMYDAAGNHIEFDILVNTENDQRSSIINIFVDELRAAGITANLVPMDFQNIVSKLTESYEWDCVIVGLGSNYWPNGGSNVWQSNGNFHLWYPLQSQPETEWEARIDALFSLGMVTLDTEEAKKIYDEFQQILLSELPVMYIVHPFSFLSIRNKWKNVFYDNLQGLQSKYIYLE